MKKLTTAAAAIAVGACLLVTPQAAQAATPSSAIAAAATQSAPPKIVKPATVKVTSDEPAGAIVQFTPAQVTSAKAVRYEVRVNGKLIYSGSPKTTTMVAFRHGDFGTKTAVVRTIATDGSRTVTAQASVTFTSKYASPALETAATAKALQHDLTRSILRITPAKASASADDISHEVLVDGKLIYRGKATQVVIPQAAPYAKKQVVVRTFAKNTPTGRTATAQTVLSLVSPKSSATPTLLKFDGKILSSTPKLAAGEYQVQMKEGRITRVAVSSIREAATNKVVTPDVVANGTVRILGTSPGYNTFTSTIRAEGLKPGNYIAIVRADYSAFDGTKAGYRHVHVPFKVR